MSSDDSLARNLDALRDRIARACGRAGRKPSSVRLVAVTKGVAAETVRRAVALGIEELGENRVQEALLKQRTIAEGEGPTVRAAASDLSLPRHSVRWHLIGHLQRNKADDAVQHFAMIHSVDSLRLAEEMERCASKHGRTIEALLQVNVAGEATKFGCRSDEAIDLAEQVAHQPHLRLRGLMMIASYADDPEQARSHFRALRQLRDALQAGRSDEPLLLSMGMSGDFEVAIEEGADLVRIGTALFGPRPARYI